MNGQIHRRCPVCDADAPAPHWEKGDLRLVQCRRCSMVYADPVRADLADGAYYDQQAASYHLAPDKLASDFAPVRFVRELRLFRRHCPRGAVLDVGCSTGAFLCQLRRLGGYEVAGTDEARAALDHAAGRGIEAIEPPFLEHDFGGRRFDAITFWAVLEHVVHPRAFLARAAALLRRGGCCFALVPNLRSLAVRLLGRRYRYVMPEHVNWFSAATLRALAASVSGLEVVELRSTHFNPVVIWQDWRRGGTGPVPETERARLLRHTTALKQTPWLAPAQWLYAGLEQALGWMRLADNLVIVLRKR